MSLVDFFNALTYSSSILVILSSRIKANMLRYLICFCLLTIFQMFFGMNNYYATLVNLFVICICFYDKANAKTQAYECLCSISIITAAVMLLSCVAMLILPQEKVGNMPFNFVIGSILVMFSVIWKLIINWHNNKQPYKTNICSSTVLQALPLLFYTFVLPHIEFSNQHDLAAIVLLFLGILFLVSMLLYQLRKIKTENEILLLNKEHSNDIKQMLQKSIERDHYIIQLFQTINQYIDDENNSRLKNYFNETIMPAYNQSMYCDDVELIKSELIRNLTQNELNKLSLINGLIIDAQFIGNLHIKQQYEFTIFKILSELLANAYKELLKQKNGYFQIYFIENSGQVSFKIANSINDETIEFNDLIKAKETRYGLNMIDKIIETNKADFEHNCFIRPMLYGKWRLFVQEIIIKG